MSLKEKLYGYEEVPPSRVWDRINVSLDESHLDQEFPATLYNAEVSPPAGAWGRIASSLDEKKDAPAIAIRRRAYSFFRYAAAVAVVGIVALALMWWMSSSRQPAVPAGMASTTDSAGPGHGSIQEPSPAITVEKEEPEGKPDLIASGATGDKIRKRINYAISDDVEPAEAIYAFNDHTPELADRYVMLMTPNGIIRMSKKLGDMICCVAGELQDEDCRDQVKKWQEKLATSPVSPSPGNFMDILGLVSALSEDDL